MRYVFTVLSLLAAVGSSYAQAPASDSAPVQRILEDLRRLTREGDVAGAMALFTDDVVYMRPGEQADVGKDAVRRHWQEGVDAMVTDIEWRADEIELSENLGFARGTLTFRGTPRSGGATVTNEQRFIWVVRRAAGGSWQIARYMRHGMPRPR